MSKYKKPLAANQVNISEQMMRLRNELSKQGYITSLSPNYVLDSQLVGADYLRHSPAASHLQDATAVIYTVGGNFTVSLFHHKRIEPMHVYLDSDLEWVGPADPEDSYIAHYSNLGQLLADHPSQGDLFSSDWFVFEKQYEFSGTADTDAHLKGIETKDQSCDQELRHQFDFDRSDFTKVYARLANFLNDNGNEREKLEVHQHGLLEVQLNIMTLLENLINCHGGDIGENGEVMTCLTLPEALMFVDAGFTVRHKTWIPGDSISKGLFCEGGSAIYRVGVDLPWEIPSLEVFRKNWVLLYKEV